MFNPNKTHKIIFPECSEFLIRGAEIKMSKKLETMFTDELSKKFKDEIVINDIDHRIFSHLITFMKYMSKDNIDSNKIITEEIYRMSGKDLIDFINISDYFKMKNFVDIAEKRFKEVIETNDPQDIRKIFGIKNDFGYVEESQLEIALPWE